MIERSSKNPLITPNMVKPSNEGLKVLGAFNPGATHYNDEIILLLRVAESCEKKEGLVSVPYYEFTDKQPKLCILDIPEDDPELTLKDTRGVFYKQTDYLSTLSHLRLARSKDGINFTVEDKPFLSPSDNSAVFGVEDARISKIEDTYYINYTVVSGDGYATALSSTKNFDSIVHHGIIFPPLNKDVAIFEEKVNNKYIALHRPDNHGFGKPSIWYAESNDLISWGKHQCILRPNKSVWETQKIGAGAAPIKTELGWLEIYHAKGDKSQYSLNLLLLDLQNPSKIVGRTKNPIMFPETSYEKEGFFSNVLFTNGHIVKSGGEVSIYYGASDEFVCMTQTTIDDLLNHIYKI